MNEGFVAPILALISLAISVAVLYALKRQTRDNEFWTELQVLAARQDDFVARMNRYTLHRDRITQLEAKMLELELRLPLESERTEHE